jgi:maltose alpha-D-glucosyltransferase/alpha-amylase
MAHRADWDGQTVIAIHNLGKSRVRTAIKLDAQDDGESLVDLFGSKHAEVGDDGRITVTLGRYDFRWLRLRRRGQPLAL